MRLAAIDIGTNSIHMIVVQVRPDLSFEVIDREKDMVRLGAGGLDGKSLTQTATAAALTTLSKFKRLAESHKVDEIIAGATSATREAENGGDFIAEVDRLTGIKIRVISGTEEARLVHLAAAYGVDVGSSTACAVDIGGGSVEVTLGTAASRSEEHTSELQSLRQLVCRLLLEKKKNERRRGEQDVEIGEREITRAIREDEHHEPCHDEKDQHARRSTDNQHQHDRQIKQDATPT